MSRGSKDKYTDRRKREADDFEEAFVKKSVSETEAEKRVWATMHKESEGAANPEPHVQRK